MTCNIYAHVCVDDTSGPARYGRMARYGQASTYCGALDALLRGDVQPFACQLNGAFLFEGLDRLAALQEVDENVQALSAKVTCCGLGDDPAAHIGSSIDTGRSAFAKSRWTPVADRDVGCNLTRGALPGDNPRYLP